MKVGEGRAEICVRLIFVGVEALARVVIVLHDMPQTVVKRGPLTVATVVGAADKDDVFAVVPPENLLTIV